MNKKILIILISSLAISESVLARNQTAMEEGRELLAKCMVVFTKVKAAKEYGGDEQSAKNMNSWINITMDIYKSGFSKSEQQMTQDVKKYIDEDRNVASKKTPEQYGVYIAENLKMCQNLIKILTK